MVCNAGHACLTECLEHFADTTDQIISIPIKLHLMERRSYNSLFRSYK